MADLLQVECNIELHLIIVRSIICIVGISRAERLAVEWWVDARESRSSPRRRPPAFTT